VQATLRGAVSIGKNTLALRLEGGDEADGDMPVYDHFQLGGPRRLSGLFLDQLTGNRYILGVMDIYRRYASLPPQLGRGLYVGVSLESGRINDPFMEEPWEWVTAGSVYWGADTTLGAVYFGYGYSSLGQGIAYLMIGPQF
jgi:NTE family protein